jgi:hypothetical protein
VFTSGNKSNLIHAAGKRTNKNYRESRVGAAAIVASVGGGGAYGARYSACRCTPDNKSRAHLVCIKQQKQMRFRAVRL